MVGDPPPRPPCASEALRAPGRRGWLGLWWRWMRRPLPLPPELGKESGMEPNLRHGVGLVGLGGWGVGGWGEVGVRLGWGQGGHRTKPVRGEVGGRGVGWMERGDKWVFRIDTLNGWATWVWWWVRWKCAASQRLWRQLQYQPERCCHQPP